MSAAINIKGPYPHKSGHRCRVLLPTGLRKWYPSAPTKEEARTLAEQVAALQQHESSQTVGACAEAFVAYQQDKGLRHYSIKNYRMTLARFFGQVWDLPLGRLTATRCEALHESLRKRGCPTTGRPYAVCTYRHALVTAKAFLSWCVKRRWLRANPATGIEGVGVKSRGKAQPTYDEARTLWNTCLREAAVGDDGALATAIALSMGLRAGEIASRTVRDLDVAAGQNPPPASGKRGGQR